VKVQVKGLIGDYSGWECLWCHRIFIGDHFSLKSLPPHECILSVDIAQRGLLA
jgi:hypothetical protein